MSVHDIEHNGRDNTDNGGASEGPDEVGVNESLKAKVSFCVDGSTRISFEKIYEGAGKGKEGRRRTGVQASPIALEIALVKRKSAMTRPFMLGGERA